MNTKSLSAILLISTCFYLLISSPALINNEDTFSPWYGGDTQTLLTLRHWERTSPLAHYFLFTPQGYHKSIDILDRDELKQHGHGINPGVSAVGPTVRYTHYPAGYLIPFYLLYEVVGENIMVLKALAFTISLCAVLFFYLFVQRIFGTITANLAATGYLLAPQFLPFSIALANQPMDDLWRMILLYLTARWLQADATQQRKYLGAILLGQLLLSLSSYDSVIFIYCLITITAIVSRLLRPLVALVLFALPVVAGLLVQFLQNALYLGTYRAWQDLVLTFIMRSDAKSQSDYWSHFAQGFFQSLGSFLPAALTPFALTVAVIGIAIWLAPKNRLQRLRPQNQSWQMLITLALAAIPFYFILPSASTFSYQGKQFLPFIVIALAIGVQHFQLPTFATWNWRAPRALWLLVATPLFLGSYLTATRIPPHNAQSMPEVQLARAMKSAVSERKGVIYFNFYGFKTQYDYYLEYPQIFAPLEYEIDAPILCFRNPNGLIDDFRKIKELLAQADYTPILLVDNPNLGQQILARLRELQIIPQRDYPVQNIQNLYYVIL